MKKKFTALDALKVIGELKESDCYVNTTYEYKMVETALKESEKKDNALKTISDIIRDFNNGEFASGEVALEEISTVLREVLL